MIVAGIDPSLTSAGVAVLQDGKPIPDRITHHGFSGTKYMTYEARDNRIRYVCSQVLAALCERCNERGRLTDGTRCPHSRLEIDLAAIEQFPEHGRLLPGTADRNALWWGIFGALRVRKVPVAIINPMTLKTWTTGSGSADKAAMVATVSKWHPDLTIACDDEADALALACIGAFHLGDPMPFDVKPRHTTGLEKVQWP